MCAGFPMRVISIDAEASLARVAYGESERDVTIATLDGPVEVGDWVLVYLGMAMRRLDPDEVREILAYYGEGDEEHGDRDDG